MRRVRLRFRLYHLLAFVAVAACCAWWIRSAFLHAEFERRTIRAIVANSHVDVQVTQRNVLGAWAARILPMWNRVTELSVDEANFDDSELRRVAQFWELEYFSARGTQISDRGIAKLCACRRLVYLDVSDTGVTDVGARAIGGLHQLEVLKMDSTKVSDEGVWSLHELRELQVLHLAENGITDRAIPTLCRFGKLMELDLRWTDVSEKGYQQLERTLPQDCVLLGD